MQLASTILFYCVVDPCLLFVGDFAMVIDYSKIIGSSSSAVSKSASRYKRPVFVNFHHTLGYTLKNFTGVNLLFFLLLSDRCSTIQTHGYGKIKLNRRFTWCTVALSMVME